MYMDEGLKEDELYQLVDQFNERKIKHEDYYSTLLNNIHYSFYDWNRRTCKILFFSSFC